MNQVQKSAANPELRAGAVAIVRLLRDAGHESFWAGGCVRDMLLGKTPADYDIATSALPDQIVALFDRCVEVGKAFGVIQVLWENFQYDVATFRAEGSYSDGRRPDHVEWANAREDVIRRDFSINGLLYDPVEDQVIDFVGGEDDLRKGVIRAIGVPSERFGEDALRILRALRFSARLGFDIAPETWNAIAEAVPTITKISAERIRYELERLLEEGGAFDGLGMLRELGLWKLVLPEISSPDEAISRFGDRMTLSKVVAWSRLCLGQNLSDPELRGLGKRLRMSRDLIEQIVSTLHCADMLSRYDVLPIWDRKKLVRHTCFRHTISALENDPALASCIALACRELDEWSDADLNPAPLLTGRDLSEEGYAPGPLFGRVLAELENRQLDGTVGDREEALSYVAELAQDKN